MRYDRREFVGYFAGIGLGSTLLPGLLWARAAAGEEITKETIACAEEIAGLTFDETQRAAMVDGLKRQRQQVEQLHKVAIPNAVPPALTFDPLPPELGRTAPRTKQPMVRARIAVMARPQQLESLAFRTVSELASLVRQRKVTSTELTRMYLSRLRQHQPAIKAVISFTEERALRQAKAADEDIARGRYRGPLHGIPWGAKDLLAVKGYPTTWGAGPYRDQVIDEDATVVRRLDAAGAVLIAKLSLGELAQGDVWFGRGDTDAGPTETTRKGWRTRNPWNPKSGSSGSSAGPGAATAGGLVGFAIGSETLGSISSPSTVNGVTGLRPTFGRVPRTGAMALSWSMDKLGPMCRGVEDCAFVLDAIHGADGADPAARDAAFHWNANLPLKSVRVGFVKSAFDLPERNAENRVQHLTKRFDDAALDVLRALGVTLIPVELPDMPYGAMRMILTAEAAAAFDDLTRSGRDRELVQQGPNDWANSFRVARFISATDYINANRVRTMAMRKWAELFKAVDVIVTPTSGAGFTQLIATNLTGHPAVILKSGFREANPDEGDRTLVPVSLTFLGDLYDEARLLAVARAYEQATEWRNRHPEL